MSKDMQKRLHRFGVDLGSEFVIAAATYISELEAERERLALAICGGEDAPGYANAQTVGVLEKVASDNRLHGMWLVDRIAALEAQVAVLTGAGKALLDLDMQNTCQHENTHLGGFQWEICEDCGRKWADDMGGKPQWVDPPEWIEMLAALSSNPVATSPTPDPAVNVLGAEWMRREIIRHCEDGWPNEKGQNVYWSNGDAIAHQIKTAIPGPTPDDLLAEAARVLQAMVYPTLDEGNKILTWRNANEMRSMANTFLASLPKGGV